MDNKEMLEHNLKSLTVLMSELQPKLSAAEELIKVACDALSNWDFLFSGGWDLDIMHRDRPYRLRFARADSAVDIKTSPRTSEKIYIMFGGKGEELQLYYTLNPRNTLLLAEIMPSVVAYLAHEISMLLQPSALLAGVDEATSS